MNFTVELPKFKEKEYFVEDFGTLTLDTLNNQKIIQKAIDEVSKNGGGTLTFPAKIIQTGPIVLKSDVCLNLVRNCYLKFPKEKRFYKVSIRDWEGMECYRTNSPIEAFNESNIGIVGDGTIDGCGDDWRPLKEWKVTSKFYEKCLKKSPYYIMDKETRIWYPSKTSYDGSLNQNNVKTLEQADEYFDFYRPVLISIVNCDKVLLKDFISSNSPAWNIHPLFTTNLTVDGLKVKNDFHAQNGDGIDVESCTNVEIKNSTFEVGDDGICIKSGKNRKARQIKKPTSNVYIHDCLVYHAHGGIVIGSEMSRGVNNLLCENCTFVGTDIGIRFKSAIGRGGVVENITIQDINMIDIINEAIIYNMDYSLFKMAHEKTDDVKALDKEDIPYFKNILMKNINCSNSHTVLKVLGINPTEINDFSIQDIRLVDSYINGENNYSVKWAKGIKLENTTLNVNGIETYFKNVDLTIDSNSK